MHYCHHLQPPYRGFATNALSGTVPPTLGNLLLTLAHTIDSPSTSHDHPPSTSCRGFATNALSGIVPPTLGNLLRLTELELNESGTVCPGASQPPSPPPPANNTPPPPSTDASSSSSSGLPLGAIIGIAVAGVLVIVLLVIGLFLLWKRRSKPQGREEQTNATQATDVVTEGSGLSVVPSQALMCQRYSFATVSKATNDWAEANHIGSGGYGEAVEEMASKSHPHLVRLLGYCVDMDMTTEHHEQIVIYEFCSNGDLEKYLSGEFILTRPAVVEEKGINTSIKDWAARRMEDRDAQALKDPHLDSIPSELLLQAVELALQCTGMPASSLPRMREAAARLDALSKEFLQKTTSKADSRLESIDQEVAMRQPEQSLDDEFLRIDVISGACD
ncbi:unnamed protein product [Closterium sp. NIES-64]|nr:unnamed protein product [Closterium sp. NIES-64]